MGTSPKNILVNKSGRDRYTRPTDIDNVIKYELRKNKKPKKDLITCGGVGVMEFLGVSGMIDQFHAVSQLHTRKGAFGRYIDHEIFSLSLEAERLVLCNKLDVDAIAREMAYDFYEIDHCQVIYAVHYASASEETPIMHIHFAINAVNFVTGGKRRENWRQTLERSCRFNKIMEDAVDRAR